MASKGGDRIMELKNRSQYLDKLISVQDTVSYTHLDVYKRQALMYGIGHGGVEAILIGGLSGISNLVSMLMINSGAMQLSLIHI